LHSFQWKITTPVIVLIIASMAALGIYLTTSIRNSQLDNLRFHLEQEAKITAEAGLPSLLGQGDSPDTLAKKLGKKIDSRVTIIAPDGTVLGDSIEDPATMENHATRPEIKDALATGIGESTRYSITLKEQMMYVAVTISNQGGMVGIARVALPITTVEQKRKSYNTNNNPGYSDNHRTGGTGSLVYYPHNDTVNPGADQSIERNLYRTTGAKDNRSNKR